MYMILYILILFVLVVILLGLYGAFSNWKERRIVALSKQAVGPSFPGLKNISAGILERLIHRLNKILDTILNMSLKSIYIKLSDSFYNFSIKLDPLITINIYLFLRLYIQIVPYLNFELLWGIL